MSSFDKNRAQRLECRARHCESATGLMTSVIWLSAREPSNRLRALLIKLPFSVIVECCDAEQYYVVRATSASIV